MGWSGEWEPHLLTEQLKILIFALGTRSEVRCFRMNLAAQVPDQHKTKTPKHNRRDNRPFMPSNVSQKHERQQRSKIITGKEY